eukprot:75143-Prorocentrum_minimum.AAC.2
MSRLATTHSRAASRSFAAHVVYSTRSAATVATAVQTSTSSLWNKVSPPPHPRNCTTACRVQCGRLAVRTSFQGGAHYQGVTSIWLPFYVIPELDDIRNPPDPHPERIDGVETTIAGSL